MSEDLAVVSHEQNGRILSGVGADANDLAETMDRHTPEDRQVEPKETPAAEVTPAVVPGGQSTAVAEPSQPEKPLTRGQKRFADLTREREDARREAAALRAEVEQLKQSRAPSPTSAPVPTPEPARAAAPEPTRAKPTEDLIGTQYQTYADFVEDLADWRYEQRTAQNDLDARIRTAIEADRASRSFQDTVTSVLDAGRKAFPDFDAVRATSDVKFPAQAIEAILAMESPAHVMYQLAKNRDLALRVATSDPYSAGLLLASLKTAPADARPASSAQPSVTPPPPPYQPVQGGSPTTVTPSAERANGSGYDYDKSGYREARAAERARSSRRA